jgi:PAS domain S-box-containing protein
VAAHTVLVVEDNPLTRKMLRLALAVEGLTVREAGSAEEALAAAADGALDLVLADYVLPDTDGLGLLRDIRAASGRPELPALLVTGLVSRLDELRAEAGRHTQVLAKPIEPAQLLELLRAHFEEPADRGRGRRILVVDDDPLNLKLASLHLQHAGYQVACASSALDGLARARAEPPDAIVADVLMPVMDGFKFCMEVRKDPALSNVPIVLVSSAYVDPADHDLARRVGASALVLRSADMREALDAMERCFAGNQPVASSASPEQIDGLHRDRLQVQLERQTARNEILARQAAIQATALSVIRGLSEALANPRSAPRVVGDVLVHCLDATGLSTGLLYLVEDGRLRLEAQFGVASERLDGAAVAYGQQRMLQEMIERGEPSAVPAAGSTDQALAFLRGLGQGSALFVPFSVLERGFGLLVLSSDSHDLSDDAWIGFARTLAAQFGQTVALGQSLSRLAASEERYRTLMEQAHDAILFLDTSQRILTANRQAERLLLRPGHLIEGRSFREFVAPPADEGADTATGALAMASVAVVERELSRADGTRVPVELSASLVRLGPGSHDSVIVAILRDVTERRRVEVALREAQQRLSHLVSSSPSVLFSLRPQGEKLVAAWVSSNVENLLGYDVETALAPGWWQERLHPDDRDAVLAEMPRLREEGYLVQEYRFRLADGAYRWMHAELRLLRDPSGRPIEVIGSWSDVTTRREAELRVQKSERQYRLLFQANPQPMWVFDEETLRFLAVNDAAVSHYGWSREEFLSMTIHDLRPPSEHARLDEIVAQGRREHRAMAGETLGQWRHQTRDGRPIDVEGGASPIRFQGRAAWLVMVNDVTDRKRLEAQFLQAQKMESIGRLAGGVAHDFNNILGVITGYGEMLRKRVTHDERLAKYAGDILGAATRGTNLTRQLLAFSRRQVLQPRVLDVNVVIADLENLLRRLIGEDKELSTQLQPDLLPVQADAGQLEQVLMNLVVNACDAMPRGGSVLIETADVEFDDSNTSVYRGVQPGRYVMVAVSDTGHGMTADVQARIFEPFFTTKEQGKGTGLGLATVHGIVRQSGGHIFVYSEPGRGTTFKVYLPAVARSPVRPSSPSAEESSPTGTETVLVVEDEAPLREIVKECLEESGYRVLEASSGPAALALSEAFADTIHLLLTDVIMPEMGGAQLAARLRERRPGLRVVYMSGYTDDAMILHGVLTQGVPLLEKPFTPSRLALQVREVLDRPEPTGQG